MKKLLLWLLLFFATFAVKAQDTLTVLQYNLLNYGNFTSYCTQTNNDYLNKDKYIHTIVNYVKPDIFTVNEISVDTSIQVHLLHAALNIDGVNCFSKAGFIRKNTYSDLGNMLYYNHDKLGLAGHTIAQSYIRDVDVYKLYYRSSDLQQGDTVFIYCVVAHLKSSSGGTNQTKRADMANNTMHYIASHDPDNNYLLMGDFNLYTSSEPAYQDFTGTDYPKVRFNDPIDKPGNWHNNADFSLYQTQSTHSSSNGCAVSGGMDDRFDFILISNDIKYDTKKVKYVQGSFHAVGQDGKHFNQSINSSPANTSVPANVLNALYNNSDHLPVTLKVAVNQPTGIPQIHSDIYQLSFTNPVNNVLNFKVNSTGTTSLKVEVFSLVGKKVMQQKYAVSKGHSRQTMNVGSLPNGLYILRFTESNGHSFSRKLLKY